jgi:para-nitrobenzyl esterase
MVSYYRVVVAAYLCATFLGGPTVADDNPLRCQTRFGTVEGYADEECGLWAWKGIPFAKPPVGDLRWRSPEDPEPWEGVRAATKEPPECVQPKLQSPLSVLPETSGSEDCLYLNIFRPQTAEQNLPVYFWIHGGGNIVGGASGRFVQDLASKANIVLVETQYRLGVLGYFTHPAFRTARRTAEASGNFGTLDQIKALKWVRDNIAAFGGNPFNVTIGGYSAGGHNVAQLKISPLACGLFHRAVIQSEPWLAQSVAEMDDTANLTIDNALIMKGAAGNLKDARRARIEMTDIELAKFLRDVPASDLVNAYFSGRNHWIMSPVIEDGLVIPGHLHRVVESGRYEGVPTIIGSTETDAGFSNISFSPLYEGMADYRGLAQVVQGAKTFEEVLPTPKDREYWLKARSYCSLFCRAMSHEHARRLAARQNDVFVYLFCWGGEKACSKTHAITYGAAHCIDLPFFFGNIDKKEQWLLFSSMYRSFTGENRPGRLALSEAMVSYLAQFMRTGNPNSAVSRLPEWQAWSNDVGGPKVLQLDADLKHAQIGMDSRELSIAGIRRALDNEPAELRRHVLAMASAVQPFLPYEPGDFQSAIER